MTTGGVTCSRVREATPLTESSPGMSRVCRTLFGPIDHEANRQFVRQELAELQEEVKNKWNFDFDTETPLEGRYEWAAAGDSRARCSAAGNYMLQTHSRFFLLPDTAPSPTEAVPSLSPSEASSPGFGPSPPEYAPCRQPRVTEFMRKRKAPLDTKSKSTTPSGKLRHFTMS